MCESSYDVPEQGDSEQVKLLKQKIIGLQARLDAMDERCASLGGGSLLRTGQADLYPGEQHDFILSVLEQIRPRCPEGSRPREIVDSLLCANKPVGRGREILDELERIFRRGDPTGEADISALRALGFSYTPSHKHPKLRFMDRYMFVLAGTPSDSRRGAMNKLQEINKCIAVEQKV